MVGGVPVTDQVSCLNLAGLSQEEYDREIVRLCRELLARADNSVRVTGLVFGKANSTDGTLNLSNFTERTTKSAVQLLASKEN